MNNKHLSPSQKVLQWASLIFLLAFISPSTTGYAQNTPYFVYLPIIIHNNNPPDSAQWTFMVYMDGDNDLEGNGIDDFLWMSSVGSTQSVNLLVQFDRIRLPLIDDTRYDDWTDAKRYRVTQGMTPNNANALQHLGEVNMGNPQTLIDFVQWSIANYPAEHYALVFWDHGWGWKPNTIQLATDFTDSLDGLEMPELRNALSTITNGGEFLIDLIGFDACMMAMIEVDSQIIPYGSVRVGSEEIVARRGLPYHLFLADLKSDPFMSAAELGKEIVQDYYDYYKIYPASAVNLGTPYIDLNTAVDHFAQSLINGLGEYSNQIGEARSNTQYFLQDDSFLDLYDFAYQINQHITDASMNSAASAVMNAIDSVVIHEQHSTFYNTHGIAIYFPASGDEYDTRYNGTSNFLVFTANNHWDEWLRAYFSSAMIKSFALPFITNSKLIR